MIVHRSVYLIRYFTDLLVMNTRIKTTDISYMKNLSRIDEYEIAIGDAWRKAAESIIEVGTQLNLAKKNLDRNEWRELQNRLETNKIMSAPTVSKLMTIASKPVLTNPNNLKFLPPSYATLYALCREDDNEVQEAFDTGKITISTELKEFKEIFSSTPNTPKSKSTATKKEIKVSLIGDIDEDLKQELLQVLHLCSSRNIKVDVIIK